MEVRTKKEFLERLAFRLSHLADAERDDILYDYEEHFQIGLERGESEEDIIRKLGNPSTIAAQYRFEQEMRDADFVSGEKKPQHFKLLKPMFTAIGLGFFNILFVLGLYIAVVMLVFSGFLTGFLFILCGGLCMILPWFPKRFFFISLPLHGVGTLPANFFLLFAGIAVICLGFVLAMVSYRLAKLIYGWTYSYLRGNMEVIRNSGK